MKRMSVVTRESSVVRYPIMVPLMAAVLLLAGCSRQPADSSMTAAAPATEKEPRAKTIPAQAEAVAGHGEGASSEAPIEGASRMAVVTMKQPLAAPREEPERAVEPPAQVKAEKHVADRELRPGETLIRVRKRWESRDWFDGAWQKRVDITISPAEESVSADQPVRMVLDIQEGMKPDFSDLRITTSDGTTEIPFVLENVEEGRSAGVRLLLPERRVSEPTIILAYFDNPNAASASCESALGLSTQEAIEQEARVGRLSDREISYIVRPSPEALEAEKERLADRTTLRPPERAAVEEKLSDEESR